MRTVVLVPYRGDNSHRDRAWRFVLPKIEELGFPVYVGDDGTQPFSVSRSWNQAAAMAGKWDLAILHAPDVFLLEPETLHRALPLADDRMVYAFDSYMRLTKEGTERAYAGATSWPEHQIAHRKGKPKGEMPPTGGPRVVPRGLWDKVGGFDPRFVGWGAEDMAFAHCCSVLGRRHLRLQGTLVSLFHPRAKDDPFRANRQTNKELYWETRDIKDPEQLRAYIAARNG